MPTPGYEHLLWTEICIDFFVESEANNNTYLLPMPSWGVEPHASLKHWILPGDWIEVRTVRYESLFAFL
jgi:mannosyltransferase OCH1-like enzyme